jgi:hypothetical protein
MLPQLNPFSLMNIAIGIENQLVGQHRADSIVIPRDKQVISPQTYIYTEIGLHLPLHQQSKLKDRFQCSVVDSGPGCGAFLTPGSWIPNSYF